MRRLFIVIILIVPVAALAGMPEFKVTPERLAGLSAGMQRQVAGLQYILNAYQLRQLLSLPDDEARHAWIDRFWKANDPTPTTSKNEMMIEHNIRVNLARQFFVSKHWPGWDKRGEVFIRYGPPNYRGKIHAEVTVRKVHAPGELWYYHNLQMVVSFRDESLNGEYKYAINPYGATQDMDTELVEFLLYDVDASVEQTIPSNLLEFYRDPEVDMENSEHWTAMHEHMIGPQPRKVIRPRMGRVTERWDEIVDPDTWTMLPANPSDVFQMEKAQELANNFEGVLEDTPTTYPFNFDTKKFEFFFGIDQFKGGDNINRVEVNIEFPLEPGAEDEQAGTRNYSATAVFWDADHNEVARDDRAITLPVPGADAETRLIPAQIVFSLAENYYRMAVTVSRDDASRSSSYRSTMVYQDFAGELAISDILFAQKIAPVERLSPFNRGAVEVVPHPIRRYRKGDGVPVYFELYNLGVNEDGVSTYEIEYRIVPHSGKKEHFWDRFDKDPTVVSSRFQGSGYGKDEPLHVTVQSENLAPGAYDFLISVKDVFWQSVTYRQATFRIVE